MKVKTLIRDLMGHLPQPEHSDLSFVKRASYSLLALPFALLSAISLVAAEEPISERCAGTAQVILNRPQNQEDAIPDSLSLSFATVRADPFPVIVPSRDRADRCCDQPVRNTKEGLFSFVQRF